MRSRFIALGGLVYLIFFLSAVYWNQKLSEPRSFILLSEGYTPALLQQTLINIGLGAVAGLGIVGLFRMFRSLPLLKALEEEIAKLLGAVDWQAAFYLALFSSVGEEALFRGAMQNAWGIHWTSLSFGMLHILNQRVWYWMVLAWGMGYLLGYLYLWTGDLVAPICCHFVINFINLQLIGRRAREMGYQ